MARPDASELFVFLRAREPGFADTSCTGADLRCIMERGVALANQITANTQPDHGSVITVVRTDWGAAVSLLSTGSLQSALPGAHASKRPNTRTWGRSAACWLAPVICFLRLTPGLTVA